MRAGVVILLIVYGFGMAFGQLLFKMAAIQSRGPAADGRWWALLVDWHFLLGLTLYTGLTLLWVWILTFIPLSRAYPFVVVAFLITPLLAYIFLGESVDRWYFVGLGLIVSGLGVVIWKTT